MDRREALKRLGVGGALAVTAPLLLDSFNVAHAMSPGPVEEKLPDGAAATLINPPATTKTNSVTVQFNESAFKRNGTLWFYWTQVSAIPAIKLDVSSDSTSAQIKKATGQGNLNSFTIAVDVYEEVVTDDDTEMVFVATYLVVSEGGLLTVTLQPS